MTKLTLRDYEVWNGIHSYSISAFDKEQAVQFFRDNFKDDPEIGKVRITRVQSGNVNQLGDKLYTIFFRIDEKCTNRPNCIECNSSHVISRGKEWYCRNCGRHWIKIRRRQLAKK